MFDEVLRLFVVRHKGDILWAWKYGINVVFVLITHHWIHFKVNTTSHGFIYITSIYSLPK